MNPIVNVSQSIKEKFTLIETALQTNSSLVKSENGVWLIEGRFQYIVRIFKSNSEVQRVHSISKVFIEVLTELEKANLYDTQLNKNILKAFYSFSKILVDLPYDAQSLVNMVAYRVAALRYRVGDKTKFYVSIATEKEIYQRVSVWITNTNQTGYQFGLTVEDKEILSNAFRHVEFSQVLIADENIRESFFNWALRDKNPPEIFIKYPSICERIQSCNLAGRIGKFRHNILIATQSIDKHEITLPFKTNHGVEEIDITDESRVISFETGYTATVKKVMECFAQKNEKPGEFEIINGCITHWNSYQLGHLNADGNGYESIDLEEKKWWLKLPPFQILKSVDNISKDGFAVRFRVLKENIDTSYEERTSYLEFIYRLMNSEKIEYYAVLSFGFSIQSFLPRSVEQLDQFEVPTRGKISYPAESVFEFNGPYVGYIIPLPKSKAKQLLNVIRADLIKSKNNEMIFTFPNYSENVSPYAPSNKGFWPTSIIKEVFGEKSPPFHLF